MVKEIQLTKGMVALVDDDDCEYLNKWKWQAHKKDSKQNKYAARRNFSCGSKKYMHRYIFEIHGIKVGPNYLIDHINGNPLDNRKENLRVCLKHQNCANVPKIYGISSKYKCVHFYKGGWVARIGGRYFGIYNNEEYAAKVANYHMRDIYGEFAFLNDVEFSEEHKFIPKYKKKEKIAPMLDPDMRILLRDFYARKKVKLVDEVNLNKGKSRIDLLDTLSLTGYEIKSDGDTFARLPNQIKTYNSSLPYIYICITNKHKEEVFDVVPAFYGVILVSENKVEILRKAKLNKEVKSKCLIQIMWKNELISMLKELGIKHSMFQRKRVLQAKIADTKPNMLIPMMIKYINQRTTWR